MIFKKNHIRPRDKDIHTQIQGQDIQPSQGASEGRGFGIRLGPSPGGEGWANVTLDEVFFKPSFSHQTASNNARKALISLPGHG